MDIYKNNRTSVDIDNNMLQVLSKTANNMFSYRPVLQTLQPALSSFVLRGNLHMTPVSAKQQELPHLPVPPLTKTLDKYLKTVKPFLSETEYKNTSDIVKKFGSENGIGDKLQTLLTEKARQTQNWLAEWWLHSAYLDYRWPVVVYSSPGLVFPLQNFKNHQERLQYTAKLILAAIDYKLHIDGDKIPLEKMGKDPLDMAQYRKIFGTCRIPGINRDALEFNSTSTHIAVAHNNHFFKIQLWNDKGELLNEKQLLEQLNKILEQSAQSTDPIGILTTENRDKWGEAYHNLITDSGNKKSLSAIQKSLFLVSLDKPMPNVETVNRQTVAGAQLIHGGGSTANAGNRWYDKTIQFIIGNDGIVGLTYEHSPSEGQPIAVMTDYLVEYIAKDKSRDLPGASSGVKGPEKLHFNVSSEIQAAIAEAKENMDKLVDNLDMYCFTFTTFGKEFVKAQKLSPDSFIQMAMQFAFYRVHKEPGAHYESAATRKFIHGRTETIRSCSVESVKFAQAMLDSKISDIEKVAAMKAAIQSHKQYSVEAVNGCGVDRHLLGLKLTAIENGIELPPIYSDKAFAKSAHMRISSSQVATRCNGFMCYGPLVDDGYACCYNPRADDMNFGISAFNSNSKTSAAVYKNALEQSLIDMHDLLAKSQQAKL